MTPERLLTRIARGELHNVRFPDLHRLMTALGFGLHRVRGSHRVYVHPGISETIVVQSDRNGDAKPYQLRQVWRLVERYALELEADDD